MHFRFVLFFVFFFKSFLVFAQSGILRGKVSQALTNDPVAFASVAVEGESAGAITDEQGGFEITGLEPGLYNVIVSSVGYASQTVFEVEVSIARPAVLEIRLEAAATELEAVEVIASFSRNAESPVSLRSIGPNEIQRAPGGNRDISKVVLSLPGVASATSFRNDILVRGGSPAENKYFLDGIEVPVINHFQTQGSTGGAIGMINVDFIKQVDFYSGAFPANRGNALSSVFDFVQKDGRSDEWTFNAAVGATDIGLSTEGPVSENSSLVFSVRRSYLQFLFKALDLSFLPTYNDLQFKYQYKIGAKDKLTLLGLGAVDDFRLNLDANKTKEQRYTLNNLPVNTQWNYTLGAKWEHFRENGHYTLVLSRSVLNNEAEKYRGNDDSDPDNKLLDYGSREMENKLRAEDYRRLASGYTLQYGAGLEYIRYRVNTFSLVPTAGGVVPKDFDSELDLMKWSAFAQLSKEYLNNKLSLSLGIRADAASYSEEMRNMLEQLSPRFSVSYALSSRWAVNFNAGIYYQMPSYTVLGYRDTNTNQLQNKLNGLRFIQGNHLVAGISYQTSFNSKFEAEGFWKTYSDYPFLVRDSVNLANFGAGYGVVGNDEVESTGKGRAYGLELAYQQKLWKGFYGIAAYTLVKSEFTDNKGSYVPSSWDSRHIISLTGGKKFKKNWELGFRWRYLTGAPYTPYDLESSLLIENWRVSPKGLLDFSALNTGRLEAFHALNVRLDKKYYFRKWTLRLYLDIENLYGSKVKGPDAIDVVRNASGEPETDPQRPTHYLPDFIRNESGTVVPSIGVVVEL
ncbi:MAG: TonB-dependent receptor [Cytophagales bacterium]|nr:TonB-dependent receptor [Cytophagales bacterium]